MINFHKKTLLFGIIFASVSGLPKTSLANQLFVSSDMNITNANYSNNYGDAAIQVLSSNSGSPWQISLAEKLEANNNTSGLWVSGDGIATITGTGVNSLISTTNNTAWGVVVAGNLNIINTNIYTTNIGTASTEMGGVSNLNRLLIDGGAQGKKITVENINSTQNIFGIDAASQSANTTLKNMNFEFTNNHTTGTYFTGFNSKGIMNISSTLGNQWINIKNNSANEFIYAVSVGMNDSPNAQTNIEGMNINISENVVGSSGNQHMTGLALTGKLKVTGVANGSNIYIFDNNTSNDWVMAAQGWNSGAALEMKNMSIFIRGNEGNRVFGFRGQDAHSIKVTGIDAGTNTFVFSDNTARTGTIAAIQGNQNVDIDFEKMNILIKDNVAGSSMYGIYGYDTSVKGISAGTNSVVIKDNVAASGFMGIANYGTMNVENMNIEVSNNTSTSSSAVGAYNSSILNLTGVSSRNSMIVKNNSTTGFWTTGTSAITTVKNMNITSSGNIFSILVAGSTFNLENSRLNVLDASNAFEFGNTGNIVNVRNGSAVLSNGGALMSVVGTSTATMNVNASYVEGRVGKDVNATSNLNLSNNSTWSMKDNSVLSTLNSTNSQINLKSSSSGKYNTLTVSNYVGNGSNVYMNTHLGGDSSPTDKIVIDGGSATGSTVLNISNRGGSGEKTVEGIKVVDAQNGATIGKGVFSLYGGKLDTGGYEYKLYQGNKSGTDTNSMYLRTDGELSDTAKVIANVPSLTLNLAKAGMNSLYKRMGELRHANDHDMNGVWVRNYARHLNVNDKIDSKINLYGIEGGYDHQLDTDNVSGRVYLGGMIGYLYTDSVKTKSVHGEGSGNTPSVGVYATWIANDGWFVDGVVRHFWEDLDMSSVASNGQLVKYNVKRQMTAFSIETGKQMKFCTQSCTGNFLVEPKVEVGYAVAKGKTFKTNLGDELTYGDTKSLSGKASITLGYEYLTSYDMIVQPYIQFGVLREFDGKTDINYASATYDSALGGTSFEVGGGGFVKMTQSTSLYSEFLYEKGSKVEAVSGNIGIRYTW